VLHSLQVLTDGTAGSTGHALFTVRLHQLTD